MVARADQAVMKMKKKKVQQQQQEDDEQKKQDQQQAHHHQQQQGMMLLSNKGKNMIKFKRSTSNLEEDGISSAMLLIACIACTP